MSDFYYAVIDPSGEIVHTTVSLSEAGSIEHWMDIERSMNDLHNIMAPVHGKPRHCFTSWEHFEAEGYTVKKLTISICD